MVLHRLFTSITLTLSLGTAIVISDLGSALADNAPQMPEDASIPEWLQPLKLTTAQVQKMSAIRNKHQAKILQNTQNLRQAQQEFEALLVSGAPDNQLREKYRQVQTLKQQLDDARFEVTLETQDVLSYQQRQVLAELSKKRLADLRSQINNSKEE